MASTDDTTPTATGEPVDSAPRRTPRKRAPRKSAAAADPAADTARTDLPQPDPDPAAVAAPTAAAAPSAGDPDVGPPAENAGPLPAAKAVRKRASRKASAPVAAPEPAQWSEPAPAPEPAGGLEPSGEHTAAPESDVVTDPVATIRRPRRSRAATPDGAGQPVDSAHSDATDAGRGGVDPSFGVLFQAPAPSTSGRASAPAAAPAPAAASSLVAIPEPVEPELAGPEPSGPGATGPELAGPEDEPDEHAAPGGDDAEHDERTPARSRRRRGGKGRRGRAGDADPAEETQTGSDSGSDNEDDQQAAEEGDGEGGTRRRTRRRRRSGSSGDAEDAPGVVIRVREPRRERERGDEVTGLKGSTRLEAKKQRRREGREAGRRRTVITEAEFLARRESVERVMVVRTKGDRTQIGVLEDDVLVEHYISRETNVSMAGNIYLGRVQNVLPSMEAAFVDIGKGRNAVLYAGEVNWDAAGLESNQPKRIEHALSSGESVLVQVTKDPIGHKGARLTSQISLPGRYLVYVPDSSMTGISRKLPDTERARLKKILKEVVPESAGVIVRTAAEGASEAELRADVERLTATWEEIRTKGEAAGSGKGKGKAKSGSAPLLLHGEPDLTVRVIRDVFNEDFTSLVVAGQQAWDEVSDYVGTVAPDLAERVTRWTSEEDLFTHFRVDEQIAKAMDRKVWLPSGGSLVIDRTEAMTVVDVNTGKFIGSGGNLEETVTKNNIEAAEEIVRQLRLRDIGGIIVVDFIDMVLEVNRDLVVRRLLECLGRDRTKHQVAEVTSLGLVQMTRKRVGSGLIEVFGEACERCSGRGIIVHADPVDKGGNGQGEQNGSNASTGSGRPGGSHGSGAASDPSTGGGGTRGRRGTATNEPPTPLRSSGPTPAQIAAAAHAAALKSGETLPAGTADLVEPVEVEVAQPDGLVQPVEVEVAQPDGRVQPVDMPADDQQGPVVEPVVPPAPAPAGRGRRGRVVAPAGPPRESGQDHAGE